MTIIQPNKNNHQTIFTVSILMFISVAAAVWGIFLYNRLVDMRHEVKRQEENIRRAEVTNAELKNNLYNILDAKNLEPLINKQSLIFDKNPEYAKIADNRQLTTNN